MKKLIAILIVFLISGCAFGSVSIKPDGTKEATSASLFLDMKSIQGDFVNQTFKVKGSENSLDLQTLLTILQAAAAAQ